MTTLIAIVAGFILDLIFGVADLISSASCVVVEMGLELTIFFAILFEKRSSPYFEKISTKSFSL